jgi:chromosome segregation ATPase
VIDELTNIKGRIEALSAELKSLDDRQKAGLEIDIDDYNAKVKSHNSLVNKQRALIAANRDEMQTYNDLDEKDSAMVEQYNSLLRSAR